MSWSKNITKQKNYHTNSNGRKTKENLSQSGLQLQLLAVSLALYVLDKPLVLSHPSPARLHGPLVLSHPSPARLHGPLVLSHPSPARLHGPLIITTPCQVAWSNRFKPQLNLRDEHLAWPSASGNKFQTLLFIIASCSYFQCPQHTDRR